MAQLTAHDGPLEAPTVDAVRALAAAAEAHDGVEALGEQTLLRLGSGDVRHVLAHHDDRLVGYAQADDDAAELVVAPDARRRGTGRALLDAVRGAHPADAAPVRVWAHGDLPAAAALARAAGLAPVRSLWRMERDLPAEEDLTAAATEPPAGTTTRTFVVGQDDDAWLRLNARAFDWHPEQGRMTATDLRARQAEPWFDADDLLLVERDGALVASLWLKVEPSSDAGELYVLAVDPDAQGQGLGRHLTAVTLDRLGRCGLRRAVLYTEADNVGAVRTYTRAGFRTARADVQYA